MLATFKVEGFKSLFEASVELGAFNVFIGRQGNELGRAMKGLRTRTPFRS
ncbi:MAG TPA: hypothetical protein VFC23_00550 [Thermoanaerobaculia bacterium]|nr:hypothetical protein [Thermoanaerobaculia bacterium]